MKRVLACQRRLDLLTLLPQVQTRILLLMFCCVTRLTYWTRAVPPNLVADAAEEFDRRILDAFSSNLRFDLNEPQQKQAQLPRRNGGFGLDSAARGSPAAYAASWVLSLQGKMRELVHDGELEKQLADACVADTAAQHATLLPCLQQLLKSFDDVKTTIGGRPLPSLKDDAKEAGAKIQREVGIKRAKAEFKALVNDQTIDPVHRQLLHSCSGQTVEQEHGEPAKKYDRNDASSWLTAFPDPFGRQKTNVLDTAEYRNACAIRLALPLPCVATASRAGEPALANTQCMCKDGHGGTSVIDARGYHLIDCRVNGTRNRIHNEVNAAIVAAARAAGLRSKLEWRYPAGLHKNGKPKKPRADGWTHVDDGTGLILHHDTTTANPTNASHLGRHNINRAAHNVAGLAARDAERTKVLKLGHARDYSDLPRDPVTGAPKDGEFAYQGSLNVEFIGCAIEIGGTWSKGLQNWFKRVVKLGIANRTLSKRTAHRWSRRWRTAISIALQRTFARCAIEKVHDIREDRRRRNVGPVAQATFDLTAPVAAVPAGLAAQDAVLGTVATI